MKFSVVNSAGGSCCWNYGTDTFYGNYTGDNVCCIYAGFEVALSVTGILVNLSVTVMHMTVSVAVMQLEVSAELMQVTVSAASTWMTIFIVIMQIGVSLYNHLYNFKKRKKHACNFTKSNASLWVFFTFLDSTYGTKLCKLLAKADELFECV